MQDNMLKTMLQCSIEQAEALIRAYRDSEGWHAESVIGAAGALLGHAVQTSAYAMAEQGTGSVSEFKRPTNPPFGKFVNCAERIDMFIKTELDFLNTAGQQLGWFDADAMPDMPEIVARVVDQIGGDWFPRLSVDAVHLPRDWSPDAVPRFARQMRAHLIRNQLAPNVCEVLCQTLALGYLANECKDRLDPAIALRIGLETAIATANIGNLDRPYVLEPDDEIDEAGASLHADGLDATQPAARDMADIAELPADLDAAIPTQKQEIAFLEAFAPAQDIAPADHIAPSNDDVPIPDVEPQWPHATSDMADGANADDDYDAPPPPRASRLVRTKPARAKFGKRQFA